MYVSVNLVTLDAAAIAAAAAATAHTQNLLRHD
jgi:hypothetical protein